MLADLTLEHFADEVAGASPAPGGGSVAAYAGGTAASLVAMVCHLTIGRKGFEGRDGDLRSALGACRELRARLLHAVDADTQAYLAVAEGYGLPKDTPEQKAARAERIEAATRRAAEIPLATARACVEVLEQVQVVAAAFNSSAASDLGVGLQMALAGLRGALLNVETNLRYLPDDAWSVQLRANVAELRHSADRIVAGTWPALQALVLGAE